ncbi:MAG: DUF1800 domain-containing protein, partial [Sulfurimicrobium sp.]
MEEDAVRPDLLRRRLVQGAVWAVAAPMACIVAPSVKARPLSPESRSLWRACSRLGYGPNEEWLTSLEGVRDWRAWAQDQIEAALQSSRQSARIDEALAEFAAPLPDLFAAARTEREVRRQLADTGELMPLRRAAADALRRLDFSAIGHPAFFSQRVRLKAATWWLGACSDPALEHPLLARMTEFWFNHFNVFAGKGAVQPFVGHYLVHAIRAHALGRFDELLLATARHPAMLFYLDQAQSVAEGGLTAAGRMRGLNENYAREVMELHTLGVAGGYDQSDVRALARVLTGWTVAPESAEGFRFAPRLHDAGDKMVLGLQYPRKGVEAGEAEGIAALRDLARRPATAQRIALRLARYFVADAPPTALVERLKRRFLESDGDIAATLGLLLTSDEFWHAGPGLFRTPLDYACLLLNVLRAGQDRRALRLSLDFLEDAGQPLFGWPTPDGYP